MKKFIVFALALMLFHSCNDSTESATYQTREYGVYMRGKLAGKQTSALKKDGTYHYTFNYNDRGRGPELEQTLSLTDDGFINSLNITGVNYLKDTITEVFDFADGKAIWKSTSEAGEIETDEKAFFSSINGTLGDIEHLVRKLLNEKDQTIDLLPSGTVQLSAIEDHTIGGQDLRLIETTGFGFNPEYVWIDEDDRVFASVSSWVTIIDEEHFGLSEEMLNIQTKKRNAYYKKIAEEKTIIPEGQIVIKNVGLFNAKTAKIEQNKTVVINGNIIESISDSQNEEFNNATVIDGQNKTLLPGLFDNHVHIGRDGGLQHLAAGVTSVRDMANSRELITIRKEFNNNLVIGPRVVTMAGFIDQKGPYAGPGLTITNVEEGLKAIEDYANDGYDQIKLYSSIDPSWVKPLAQKAHDLGLKLSGHIPAYMLAENAIRDGYDEIQHVNMVVLNFLSDTIDSRTPKRFSEVAAHAHKLDLKGSEFQSFVSLLKEKGIILDATVSIFEGMFTTKAGTADPQFAAIIDRLPIQVQRGFYSGGLPIPEGEAANYKASFDKLLAIIKELHDQGVTVIPGTDAMPGFGLHKELENYAKAGIPANEVLQLATIVSAEVTKTADRLGSIEVGKLADIILIDGNPVENIEDIRRVELTIKDGKLYYAKSLYEAIGVKHFK